MKEFKSYKLSVIKYVSWDKMYSYYRQSCCITDLTVVKKINLKSSHHQKMSVTLVIAGNYTYYGDHSAMYTKVNHYVIYLKLTSCCMSITLQIKRKESYGNKRRIIYKLKALHIESVLTSGFSTKS